MSHIFDETGVLTVVLGEGDIAICGCNKDIDGAPSFGIVFIQDEVSHPIGAVVEKFIGVPTSKEGGSLVRLHFQEIDSLDVLIEQAQRVRRDMIEAGATPKVDGWLGGQTFALATPAESEGGEP